VLREALADYQLKALADRNFALATGFNRIAIATAAPSPSYLTNNCSTSCPKTSR
jgi:hypothetical protein